MLTVQCFFLLVFFALHSHIQGRYVQELSDKTFEKAVSKEMTLIYFYIDMCPECQEFNRTFEKAAKILHGTHPSISLAQINCEGEGQATCWQYFISDFPIAVLFADGIPTEDYYGDHTEEGIVDFIKERAPQPQDSSKLVKGMPKKDQKVSKLEPIVSKHAPIVSKVEPKVSEAPKISKAATKVSNVAPKVSKVVPKVSKAAPKVSKVAPKVSKVTPKVSNVAPKVSKVVPKVSKVTPKVSKVAPKVSKVAPKVSKVAPKVSKVAPKVSKVVPKVSKVAPKVSKVVPKVSKVHGNWGEWSDFGPCSRSCGQGIKRRSRKCDNPAPKNGGYLCRGRKYEDQRCNTQRCSDERVRTPSKVNGNWGQWSKYGPCSRTCGHGTQRRTRKCDNPSPKNGGYFCTGKTDEDRRCSDQRCVAPMNGNWGSWSTYGHCSRTCGGGYKEVVRFCNNPAPRDGGKTCEGPYTKSLRCGMEKCKGPAPVNGGWGQWSNYNACSASCGDGVERRSRVCNDPFPSNGGRSCKGPDTEKRPCSIKPCSIVIHGNWGPWSGYLTCSKPCGRGTKKRYRVCNDPPPSATGRSCNGSNFEEKLCNTEPCLDVCLPCSCRGNDMDCRMLSLQSVPQNIPSNIETLDLSENQIANIPDAVFIRNPKIRVLNLGVNRIRKLSIRVLEPLENLKDIYLNNNNISEIIPGTFYGFFYLESVDLSHNNLKTLPSGIFDRIKSLKYLSLQGNSLTSLSQKLFDRLNLLERLHLSRNKLTQLQVGLFGNLLSLQNLTLHQNKLSKLQNGVFRGLGKLKRLTLNNNNMVAVDDDVLNGLKELRMLDMRDNRFSTIPPGFLFPLTAGKISSIKFSNNPLACTCQLFMEIETLKEKISGTCDRKVPISSMSADHYCGQRFID